MHHLSQVKEMYIYSVVGEAVTSKIIIIRISFLDAAVSKAEFKKGSYSQTALHCSFYGRVNSSWEHKNISLLYHFYMF